MRPSRICLLITLCLIQFLPLRGEDYPYRFEGKFEEWGPKWLDLIALFLPADPVILHAGACYGSETAALAVRWPHGKILSFEPNPHAFERLKESTVCLNNVRLFPVALYDRMDCLPLYVCYGSTGRDPIFESASSLLRPSECMEIHYQGPIIEVPCIDLDTWCKISETDQIDFLCVDVQGAELQLLKGSQKTLKTAKVLYLHTHFFPFREGTTQYEELCLFLDASGFTPLSHWYREGLEGNAIFVRRDFFDSFTTQDHTK
ncbi:MAG: FkbM family methyltransferase [Verrucomicrobia bacterium]|nr:FkbM family methyltransferase [Verrucomicrobiota bacterium]